MLDNAVKTREKCGFACSPHHMRQKGSGMVEMMEKKIKIKIKVRCAEDGADVAMCPEMAGGACGE